MKRNLYVTCTVVVITLFLGACSTLHPIHNIESASVPVNRDGSPPTATDVADAIHQAANYKRWDTQDISDGLIRATIDVRARHIATVDISYDSSHYSIRLKESSGLDQQDGKIHRNYNKWIMLLNQEISYRIKQIGQSTN